MPHADCLNGKALAELEAEGGQEAVTVQLLLGHGLAPRADFQRPARPGIGRVSLPWSQGSVWRGSALGSSGAVRTLWADCRDGAALLKVAGAGHEALSDHHYSRGQSGLPQQGRPAAGPPPRHYQRRRFV